FHLIMGYPSMVQLMDLRFVIERLDSQINWDTVIAHAKERRVTPFIYAALSLARKTLDVAVPPVILEQLARACPPGVRHYAETITLQNLAARTQRPPVTTLAQRLQRGVQDRAEVAHWTTSLQDQWHVWKTLLDVAKTDTGAMLIDRMRGTFTQTNTFSKS